MATSPQTTASKMHQSKFVTFGVAVATVLACAMATDPLTITFGTGAAYTLTATQVSIAAASIAALAITKELLLKAGLSRHYSRRGRDVNAVSQTPLDFTTVFDAIAATDVADCGKLLVCHSMAKTEDTLTPEEKAISQLFDRFDVINPNSGYAEYQMAAYAGTFKQPEICFTRYARCPVAPAKLGELIKQNL